MQRIRSVKGPLVAALFAVLAVLFAVTVGVVTEHDGSPAVAVRPGPTTTSSSTTTTSTTTSTTAPAATTIAPAVLPPADPVPQPEPEAAPEAPTPTSGGGATASQAWWDAISACEGGGPGQYRTGYFGIEAGYPIGGLSYDDQLAWAKRILAESGPGAWGCTATVGAPY